MKSRRVWGLGPELTSDSGQLRQKDLIGSSNAKEVKGLGMEVIEALNKLRHEGIRSCDMFYMFFLMQLGHCS